MLLKSHQFASPGTASSVALSLILVASVAGVAIAQPPGRGPDRGRDAGDAQLEKAPLAASDFEKTALAVLDDIAANQRYRNVPQNDGRLLRIMAQSIGAKHVIELGTSTGYSGIWFAWRCRRREASSRPTRSTPAAPPLPAPISNGPGWKT